MALWLNMRMPCRLVYRWPRSFQPWAQAPVSQWRYKIGTDLVIASLSTVVTELRRLECYGTGRPNWPPWSKWSGTIRGKKLVTLQRASFAKENSCTRLCVQQLRSNDLPPANEHVCGVRKGTSQLIVKENAQHIIHSIALCFGRKNWSVLRTSLLLAALTCFA